MNDFSIIVNLYRLSSYPHFDGAKFSARIAYNADVKSLFKRILNPTFQAGTADEIEVDGHLIYDYEDFPEKGNFLTYSFKISQGSANRFYKNKNEFVKINTLKKGIMPEYFYIIEDDFYSLETPKPSYIQKIEDICELINALSMLAHFHDIKKDSKGTFYRLVFILNSESKSSSAVIETNITEEIFNDKTVNTQLVKTLVSSEATTDAHHIEKINTFRNTVIEYVNKNGNSFVELINKWDFICELYTNNLAAYMSAFSFHKARKEVVDAELDYSEKLSKIISEISNKALAIPISLAGSIAIFKLTTKIDWIIALIGLIITAIITSAMIVSQKKQLARISHSKEILFGQLRYRIKDDTSDLKESLEEAIKKLNDNEDFCHKVLDSLLSLAWMPTFIGIIGILFKLMPNIT
ncbi:hypothetical protein DFZ98_20760 [Escherichia coli]|nr:hypothetical protein [Escherichia coli]EFD0750764.1 hypothetical protein [Escherichia coli]EFI2911091.1 hypothetical protein [Escherichia coli]HCK1788548.1 hypothetical protein [Escherichia coli]